jgi:hypothetical protein
MKKGLPLKNKIKETKNQQIAGHPKVDNKTNLKRTTTRR